ncbi:guanine nucleotide-binding protein G(f) subunit alpha [Phlebotomus argentipes]|uniref:guanine nucleotide-binding protein G(f) subunit alpha n=1 Tax=Phlebotomus argentipes TaxID=94469 RepID=UPI002892FBBC|nr:guanine nucleotide-binding protein G(f) subunit alpha [Phlebotomus argentipes]XP_059609284.1 guanine nucleotide-binding protein G(f) subunit alpha [Phlebotomus argentipes]
MLGCMFPRPADMTKTTFNKKELKSFTKSFEKAIKILLLGTGESGKSTIINQMKILHINKFTEAERLERVPVIRQNLHESLHEIVANVERLGLAFDCPANLRSAQFVLTLGKSLPEGFEPEDAYVEHIENLWYDRGVQECFRRSNEYQLNDSAKYFIDRVQIVSKADYIPTTDDILHSRKITTTIHEIKFNVKIPKNMGGGLQEFRMIDVGGQRDQRNKWMYVFDGIDAVLFLISCGDFDQTLREDPQQNRLSEALKLFRGVWHNRFLVSVGIICFMNKQDIMERKIMEGKSIGQYFPDYNSFRVSAKDGSMFDECNKTRCFIRHKLLEITSETPRPIMNKECVRKECYFHFTIATDTNNIRKVFYDVHSMILNDILSRIGLL